MGADFFYKGGGGECLKNCAGPKNSLGEGILFGVGGMGPLGTEQITFS